MLHLELSPAGTTLNKTRQNSDAARVTGKPGFPPSPPTHIFAHERVHPAQVEVASHPIQMAQGAPPSRGSRGPRRQGRPQHLQYQILPTVALLSPFAAAAAVPASRLQQPLPRPMMQQVGVRACVGVCVSAGARVSFED